MSDALLYVEKLTRIVDLSADQLLFMQLKIRLPLISCLFLRSQIVGLVSSRCITIMYCFSCTCIIVRVMFITNMNSVVLTMLECNA